MRGADLISMFRRLRDRAPVGVLLLVGWLTAIAYLAISATVIDYLRWLDYGGWVDGRGWSLGGFFLRELMRVFVPAGMMVLFVAVVYVPGLIGLATIFERRVRLGAIFRQEYASMLSCVLGAMIFALWVTLFPLIFLIWRGDGALWRAGGGIAGAMMVLLPLPAFVMLVVIAVEVVFNLRRYQAVLIGLFSLSSLIALPLLMSAATTLCASPLLLLFLFFLLRDRIDDLVGSSRSREAFRRSLEFATLNPADASAHYNLGLLYLERGDRAEAEWSFRKAIEVDARETDASYQLGRIAREDGRLTVALQHFERVIEQDPAHSHHEIWREVGQLYYAAGQYDDALAMLDRFQRERPSDGEGRYWRGMVLDRLNRRQEAIAEMRECVEAVRSAPAYKYRAEKQWLARAEEFLRERK